LAVDIDQEFEDWFDVAINANQYEAEKYMDGILATLLTLVLGLKDTILKKIRASEKQISTDNMNLLDWDGNDETYNDFLNKNYKKIADSMKVIEEINKEIDAFSKAMKGSISEQIEFLSQYQYGLNAESMWLAGLSVDIPGMTAQQIQEILDYKYDPDGSGLDRNQRIDRNADKLKEKIALLLIMAAITGRSLDEYITDIAILFPGDENTGAFLNNLNALETTELQVAAIMALMLSYWQNRSLVAGVEYNAVWDNRICPICAASGRDFAGMVFPVNQVPVFLPQHGR